MAQNKAFEPSITMEPMSVISGWQQRLIALADNPEYVYRDTPRELIDHHYRRLTTFAGYSEQEVAQAERRLGVCFPGVFRHYLLAMGKSRGELFNGSDLATLDELEEYHTFARKLLAATDPGLRLPSKAAVFLTHQGYCFSYLHADGGFDAPVTHWVEMEREPRIVVPSFAQYVEMQLDLMEQNNRNCRSLGGYYVTLYADGSSSAHYPALSSGDRPQRQSQSRKRWWQLWK